MSIFFAALFMLSSISKIVDFQDFQHAIKQFGIIANKKIIKISAYLFVTTELLISFSFIFFMSHWITYMSAIGIMLLFTAVLLKTIVEKKKITCYCFGKSKKQTNIHLAVARNTAIIMLLSATAILASSLHINVVVQLHIMIVVVLFSVITLICKEFLFERGGSILESHQ
ncbi:hypothetical protein NQ117_00855 [Paenibacillus sp. SC116]|nr:hypothetical protein [Paenibacillus sp. SC116]